MRVVKRVWGAKIRGATELGTPVPSTCIGDAPVNSKTKNIGDIQTTGTYGPLWSAISAYLQENLQLFQEIGMFSASIRQEKLLLTNL